MSYSRWVTDNWYCFWSTTSEETTKDGQILSLWYSMDQRDMKDWTYTELLTMTKEKIQEYYACSSKDAESAMSYIREWFEDVHKDFPPDPSEPNNNIVLSETE